jgi:hypothetical protein
MSSWLIRSGLRHKSDLLSTKHNRGSHDSLTSISKIIDNEEELSTQPDRIRFHCHIMPPTWGHVLIVDNQCFYNQPIGSVYKWSSRKLWHAGTNCGLVPKYLFNIW